MEQMFQIFFYLDSVSCSVKDQQNIFEFVFFLRAHFGIIKRFCKHLSLAFGIYHTIFCLNIRFKLKIEIDSKSGI